LGSFCPWAILTIPVLLRTVRLILPAAERDFQARFGKLVAAARYSKKESKEAEAGMLALDALHKQVMPFILRRTKAQVLQDLPPKIVTDVMCSLSAIQHALYEDFQESQVGKSAGPTPCLASLSLTLIVVV
jgi:SNF2 family DNA or RNA helicase